MYQFNLMYKNNVIIIKIKTNEDDESMKNYMINNVIYICYLWLKCDIFTFCNSLRGECDIFTLCNSLRGESVKIVVIYIIAHESFT